MSRRRFLNVRAEEEIFFGEPADKVWADGVHDDTAALQKRLDDMREGGTLYFPDGVYLISAALIFYSDQHLLFSDGAVLLRSDREPVAHYMLAAYSDPDTPGYEGTHDAVISGGVFDGGESQECLTIINTVHCRNILIKNVRFRRGANWHYIEINSTENARVTGCAFDGGSYTAIRENLISELIQLDAARQGVYGPVYDVHGGLIDFKKDATPCRAILIDNCIFKCAGFPAIGHHGNDEHTDIVIRENVFDGAPGRFGLSRGYIIFMKPVHGVQVRENAFISDMKPGAAAHAVVMMNPDESACLAGENTFSGVFTEPFIGGVTDQDNVPVGSHEIQYLNYSIRTAMSHDVPQLVKWWNDGAVMAHAGFPNGLGTTVEAEVLRLSGRRMIIEIGETPIGECSWRDLGDDIAEIGIKICEAEYQNRGVGRVVLSMLIRHLFERGFEKIVLDTNLTNLRAQHVYEKLGFRKVRVNADSWRDQLGRLQSSVDYELTEDSFVDYTKMDDKPQ